mgnify:FL=1
MASGETSALTPTFNTVTGILLAVTFIIAPIMGLAFLTSFFVIGFPVFFALSAWLLTHRNRFKIVITLLLSLAGFGVGAWAILSIRWHGLMSVL